MKILFITTDYYPYLGTTTNIFSKLFFEGNLSKIVDDITVCTIKKAINEPMISKIDGINIIRGEVLSYIKINNIIKSNRSIFYKFKSIIRKIYFWIYYKCNHNPAVRNYNVKDLVKILRTLNLKEYDAVIPIFGNYDTAAAVMKLRKDINKIILYQVDPCSTNWTRNKKEREKALNFEKELYNIADRIITMPVIYDDIVNIVGNNKYKFVPMELPLVVPNVTKTNNTIPKVVFSGFIYLGVRNPNYSIKIFKKLLEHKKCELHFVGVNETNLPKELRFENLICHGIVPAKTAERIIKEADFLLNIGNVMTNQIPSKLFDYFSTGKPIINICKNRNCPTISYCEKYGNSLILFEDDELYEEQENDLELFIKNKQGNVVSEKYIESTFFDCTPQYCSDIILKSIKESNEQ